MSIDDFDEASPATNGHQGKIVGSGSLEASKYATAPVVPTEMRANARVEQALANTNNVAAFMDRSATATNGENGADENAETTAAPTYDMSIYQEKHEEQKAENVTVERRPDEAFFMSQAAKYEWVYQGDTIPDAVKYEWAGEVGILGPRNEALELELYDHDFIQRAGANLEAYGKGTFEIKVMANEKVSPIFDFAAAGLHPAMIENLKLCNYQKPMPIQSYVIPAILLGKDVCACAQTGSGKTAAYMVPIFSRLMGKANELSRLRQLKNAQGHDQGDLSGYISREAAKPLVLVIVPTRELAVQVFLEARRFSYRTQLRPVCIYGGAPARPQVADLRAGADILIATPGRLLDFLTDKSLIDLRQLNFTVLDEADELLDEDWEEVLEQIMDGPMTSNDADHTYCMFSATFPAKARKAARNLVSTDAMYVHVGRPGSTHGNIRQEFIFVERRQKQKACLDLLMSLPPARTIIFVNSQKIASLLDDFFYQNGVPSTFIHAGRLQFEREEAMRKFITGAAPVLVATGVSARGIDVRNVLHVINYDLPSVDYGGITEYVHRIGRTGRIGHRGRATSFYTDEDSALAPQLVKLLLESKQEVPDFLQEYIPENVDNIDFEDESELDDDEDGVGSQNGSAGPDDEDDEGGAPVDARSDDSE